MVVQRRAVKVMSRSAIKYIGVLIVALVLGAGVACAQQFPERRHVREGNSLYERQRFADAEKSYRKALQKDSLSVEGAFNLGDTHYATGNFAAAEEQFRKVAERTEGVSDKQKADAYYNLGNAQFQQQKLQEALESYKQSLRLDPANLESKFNYVYTKELLKQQEQQNNQDQQQNNQQNNDQQQNQNDQQQQQDNNQQQQPEDNKGDNGQQNDKEQQQPEQPEGEKPKPSEGAEQGEQPQAGPSKESEQVLNAVQAAEDKTRDKVEGEKVVGVARSGKNW
ncbi:MAG: tetratricopeptide repeat protein [Tidjanibacter sp.]|nr:tetratricopeptide repeat protein [Tidjanibacter sp.]